MSHRPLASLSIEQIEFLFKSKGGNFSVLRDIASELTFRTTDRAKALAKRVDHQRHSVALRQVNAEAAATSKAPKPAKDPALPKQGDFHATIMPTSTTALPFEVITPTDMTAYDEAGLEKLIADLQQRTEPQFRTAETEAQARLAEIRQRDAMNNPAEMARLAEVYSRLRDKLLDMRLSNPMLSFKHRATSKTQLQIVDEVAEEVYRALATESGTLEVLPLPEPEGIPADERTEDFHAELEHAQVSDLDYLTALAALESIGRDDEYAIAEAETILRERLRAKLGMPPRPNRKTVSPIDHAKSLDIDPQAELKPQADRDSHRDRKLQTLKWPDSLTAVLDKLQSGAVLSEQEVGLSTLFLVFGFLEWTDSKDSGKRLFAPLLLLPVKLTARQTGKGKITFSITATSEQAEGNLSLAKKLETLGLVLPVFDPAEGSETPIEDYFSAVTDVISEQAGWRVRRWLTLGHFAFGRFAMYADLAPERWQVPPVENALVGAVLRGTEISGDGGTGLSAPPDDYDIDSEEIETIAPYLVRDADASQHSAVVDVMRGKNLVIQGPPGTGKSQTIANIIANALAAGKKVLFLAEKMAALEVVKRRLDEDGLGEFCLELHSDKSSAKQVIQSLKERHKLGYTAPVTRSTSDVMWQEARREIRQYLDALHAETDAGRPFEQIWRAIRTQTENGEALAHFRKVPLPAVARTSNAGLEGIKDRLTQFAQMRAEFEASFGQLTRSPWTTLVMSDEINPGIAGPLLDDLADCARQAERFNSLLQQGVAVGLGTVSDLRNSPDLTVLTTLPEPDEKLVALFKGYDRNEIDHILQAMNHRNQAKHALDLPTGFVMTDGAQRLAIEQMLAQLPDVELDRTPAQTFEQARVALEQSETLRRVVEAAAPLIQTLGFTSNFPVAGLSVLRILMLVVVKIPQDLRRAVLQAPMGAAATLEPVEAEWRALGEAEANWRSRFTGTTDRWPAVDTLLAAATIREKSGLSGLLSGFGADAKTLAAVNEALGIPATIKLDAADYRDLAGHVRRLAAFESSGAHRQIFGDQWLGLATPVQVFRESVARVERLRALFAPAPGGPETLLQLDAFGPELALLLANAQNVLAAWAGLPEPVRGLAGTTSFATLDQHLEAMVVSSRQIVEGGHAARLIDVSASWTGLAAAIRQSEALRTAEDRLAAIADPEIRRILEERRSDVDAALHWLSAVRASACDIPPLLKPGALAFVHRYRDARRIGLGALAELETSLATMEAAFGLKPFDVSRPSELAAALRVFFARGDELRLWLALHQAKMRCVGDGLKPFLEMADDLDVPSLKLPEIFSGLIAIQRAEQIRRHDPVLSFAAGAKLASLRAQFRQRDALRKEADKQAVYRAVAIGGRPLSGSNYGSRKTWTERELLHHEFGKERTSVRVLQLVRQAGRSIQAMKPCFMMSPLSLAKFVPAGSLQFDLLVIDEASQMRPEDALGGLLRARQVVVVGDPKQLPPTDFFLRSAAVANVDGSGLPPDDDDESILEACHKTFRQIRLLKWHYRSRCESLIAFSNKHIYAPEGRQLITFPAASPGSFSIDRIRIVGAYEQNRNAPEALRIAEDAILFMQHHAAMAEPPTLGIVAMNSNQAELIGEQINLLARGDDQVENYRKTVLARGERFFVKNLENVQGDERDFILISLTYGPKSGEKQVLQRFGPITLKQGHRRLNVLFTRARRRIGLYTSMDASDIKPGESSSRGVHMLQQYLAYVESGGREAGIDTGRAPDSDFEIHVAERLRGRGFCVHYQIGVSGFRMDLAVVDPDRPAHYLAGIECDGAQYHSSKSARDRDRLRQDVLENLGWSILRVWSTDWFDNPDRQTDLLVRQLEELRAKSAEANRPYMFALREAAASAPASIGPGDDAQLDVVPPFNNTERAVNPPDETEPAANAPIASSSAFAQAEIVFPQEATPIWHRDSMTPAEARQALAAYRDQVIAPTMAPWEAERSILRESMIETFVEQRLSDESEWFVKVPQFQRRSTNAAEKARFLEPICDIVARIT